MTYSWITGFTNDIKVLLNMQEDRNEVFYSDSHVRGPILRVELHTQYSFLLKFKNAPQRAQKKALDCEDFVLRACTYNGCKRY